MKKIWLREWQKEDAKQLAQAANHPEIAANLRNVFPCPYTMADAQWFIDDCIRKEGKEQLARAILSEQTVIGCVSVARKDDIYEKSAELGYWLAKDYWRQGIMTQAVSIICEEAFDKWEIVRIFAEPFAHNDGSRGVLEKNGFTYEGTMRDGVYKNGQIFSYCMYARLRQEAGTLN